MKNILLVTILFASLTARSAGIETKPTDEVNTCPTITVSIGTTSAICAAANGSVTATVVGGATPYSFLWSNGAITSSVNGIASGSYSVTATDANGCTGTATATVSSNSAQLSLSVNTTPQICSTLGSASVSVNNSAPPYTYDWVLGDFDYSNDASITAGSGLYAIWVTDTNGCTGLASANIVQQNASIQATVSTTPAICSNYGTATVTTSGGIAPLTYQWSLGGNASTAVGLPAATYTVTVTDANGCTQQASGAVTQVDITLGITMTTTPALCTSSTGTATAVITNGTAPYTFLWDYYTQNNNYNSDTFTKQGLYAGTHSAEVMDSNGCSLSGGFSQPYYFLVGSNTSSVTVTTSSTPLVCAGLNGVLHVHASGGTAPYMYYWQNVNGNALAYTSIDSISPLSVAGTYTVTAIDANGCSQSANAVLTYDSTVTIGVTTTTAPASCSNTNDGSVTLTPNGVAPYYIQWINPNYGYGYMNASSYSVSVLSPGSYSVSIIDSRGCSTTSNFTIALAPTPIVLSTVAYPQYCAGSTGAAYVVGSGGTYPYNIVWSESGNATWQATGQQITGLSSAGTYTVTVTDSHGCFQTANAVIAHVDTTITGYAITTPTYCPGNNGTVILATTGFVGPPPFTLNWDNAGPSDSLISTMSGLVAGNHSVFITDGWGCTGTINFTIPEMISVSATTTSAFCSDNGSATVILTCGGTAPYTYYWNTGSTSSSISGLAPGSYSVTVTSALGGTASASVTVGGTDVPLSVTTSSTPAVCNAANGTATVANVTNGVAPFSYLWSTGSSGSSISTVASGNYFVTVISWNGCQQTASVTVGDTTTQLVLSTTATPSICGSATGSVSVNSVANGATPYIYAWSNGSTNSSITSLTPNAYTVTVTDANGCSQSTAVNVQSINNTLTPITTSTPETCTGSNGTAAITSVNGGASPYTYVWSTGATSSSIASIHSGSYPVTITDVNGCSQSVSVNVANTVSQLVISTSNTTATCGASNGTASVTSVTGGTTPYHYVWNNNATTSSIAGLAAGVYSVTVTDANGCTNNTSVNVIGTTATTLSTVANAASCSNANGSVNLSVSGTPPFTFAWSNGATTQNISNLLAGVYNVTVNGASGCSATTSATVTSSSSCNPVTNVNVTNVTTQSATVNWTGNPCAVKYQITLTNVQAGTSTVLLVNAPATTYTFTGLLPNRSYNVSLKTQCTADGSVLSSAAPLLTFVTNPNVGACAAPTNLNVTNISTTQATASWTIVPSASGYELQYHVKPNGAWTTVTISSGSTNSILLTGLQTNKQYEAQIRTNCSGQWSVYSALVSFKTPSKREDDDNASPAASEFKLYPNPTSDVIKAVLPEYIGNAKLVVTNVLGQVVTYVEVNSERNAAGTEVPVELNGIANGLYQATFMFNGKTMTQSFVKQ